MAKMNNFTTSTTTNSTTAETLPKSGHVNEVCKEWLVREDGALAYKLQSQEINDFYKGNRFRNAVVREDFPTALQEQIKEKETAEKQTEDYRKKLKHQEEHDKRVAKEIADKLERDLQEQKLKEQRESEKMAQQMQEIYVNLPPPPMPPPKHQMPPPRPAKNNNNNHIQQQQQQQQQTPNNDNVFTTTNGYRNLAQSRYQQQQQQQYPLQLQQHHFTNVATPAVRVQSRSPLHTKSSVAVAVAATTITQQQHMLVGDNNGLEQASSSSSSIHNMIAQQQQQRHNQQQKQQQQQHMSSSTSALGSTALMPGVNVNNSKPLPPNTLLFTDNKSSRKHILAMGSNFKSPLLSPQSPHTPLIPKPTTMHALSHLLTSPTSPASVGGGGYASICEELADYTDVVDSIRQYDINMKNENMADNINLSQNHFHHHHHNHSKKQHQQHNHENLQQQQQQSGFNKHSSTKMNCLLASSSSSPSTENLLKNDKKFQKLSAEKYDQLVGNIVANCKFNPSAATSAVVQIIGEPGHGQEHADDIELYVDPCNYDGLQEIGLPLQEIKELSEKLKQEQKDELLARRLQEMEVNDGLTQEQRDRMLAIEAQDKELAKMLQEREKAKAKRAKEKARQRKSLQKEGNTVHNGPLQPIPAAPDAMLCNTVSSTSSSGSSNKHSLESFQQIEPTLEETLDLEAYSNPIDVIKQQQQQQLQRTQNQCLTNGSLNRELVSQQARHASLNREDDIYTLPVDSCRPPLTPPQTIVITSTAVRPASMNLQPDTSLSNYSQNSMTRSENFSTHSQDSSTTGSKTSSFDQRSSPTPPYMPIQGTRRSNSSEGRKKKSKDNKCTHQ